MRTAAEIAAQQDRSEDVPRQVIALGYHPCWVGANGGEYLAIHPHDVSLDFTPLNLVATEFHAWLADAGIEYERFETFFGAIYRPKTLAGFAMLRMSEWYDAYRLPELHYALDFDCCVLILREMGDRK